MAGDLTLFLNTLHIGHAVRHSVFDSIPVLFWASQVVLVLKNPPFNAGGVRDTGLTPGLRRSPRGGNGNPLQYSCLGNPIDLEAWRATVHRVTKSQT